MDPDILKKDYICPKCGCKLFEKRPKDKFIICNKENTVRLSCMCGYYRDEVVIENEFK